MTAKKATAMKSTKKPAATKSTPARKPRVVRNPDPAPAGVEVFDNAPPVPEAEVTAPAAKAAEKGGKGMSALDAAVRVLEEKGVAMTCPELIGVMAAKGYWSSPGGKTPAATLSSAIQREITTKGADSRFTKTAPGRFAAAGSPAATTAAPTVPAKKATKPAETPTITEGAPGPESAAQPSA